MKCSKMPNRVGIILLFRGGGSRRFFDSPLSLHASLRSDRESRESTVPFFLPFRTSESKIFVATRINRILSRAQPPSIVGACQPEFRRSRAISQFRSVTLLRVRASPQSFLFYPWPRARARAHTR